MSAMNLADLDPKVLSAHPDNVRDDVGDINELAASIRQVGLLQPLLVTKDGDSYAVIAGHRRLAAANKVGLDTVPCMIADSIEQAEIVLSMLAENEQRTDLTVGERAKAYQRALDLGATATNLGKAVGIKAAEVKEMSKVAASATATKVATKYDLTLEQSLTIAEFEKDKEAVKALVVAATQSPYEFDRVVQRIQSEKERAAKDAALLDELDKAGIPIHTEEVGYNASMKGAKRLDEMADGDGERLTAETHIECPGHAAYLESGYNGTRAIYICLDPKEYGHVAFDRSTGKPKSAPGGGWTEEKKEEERVKRANNKAWEEATPVRLAFVKSLVIGKSVPKQAMPFVVSMLTERPRVIDDAKERLLADIFGINTDSEGTAIYLMDRELRRRASGKVAKSRQELYLTGLVAAGLESTAGKSHWRDHHPDFAYYLEFLASCGFDLSDVERIVVDTDKAAREKQAAKDAKSVKGAAA